MEAVVQEGIPIPRLQSFLGVRADLLEYVSIGLEGGYRVTLDDYLDGVKDNGVINRDLYFFVGATLSVFLGSIEAYDFSN